MNSQVTQGNNNNPQITQINADFMDFKIEVLGKRNIIVNRTCGSGKFIGLFEKLRMF